MNRDETDVHPAMEKDRHRVGLIVLIQSLQRDINLFPIYEIHTRRLRNLTPERITTPLAGHADVPSKRRRPEGIVVSVSGAVRLGTGDGGLPMDTVGGKRDGEDLGLEECLVATSRVRVVKVLENTGTMGAALKRPGVAAASPQDIVGFAPLVLDKPQLGLDPGQSVFGSGVADGHLPVVRCPICHLLPLLGIHSL